MKFLFNSLLLVTWLTFQMCQDVEDEYDGYFGFNIFSGFDDETDYPNDPVEEVLVSPNITVYQQVEDRGHFIVMCTYKLWSHSGWSSSKLSIESDNNYTLERVIHFQHDVNCYKITVSPPVSFTCVQKARFRGNITKLHSETYIFNQSGYPTIQVNKISGVMNWPLFIVLYCCLRSTCDVRVVFTFKNIKINHQQAIFYPGFEAGSTIVRCKWACRIEDLDVNAHCFDWIAVWGAFCEFVSDHREEGVSSSYIGFVSFIAVGLIIMTVVVIVTTFKSNSKEPTTGATNNDYEDA